MKLWHKVFLGTFILFELVFNGASFYLIEHNFNVNLKNEIDRGLTEQRIVLSQAQSDWSYVVSLSKQLNTQQGSAGDFLKNNAAKYIRNLDVDKVFLEVLEADNGKLFSDFSKTVPQARPELTAPLSDTPVYILRDIGEQTYLFVTGSLVLDDKNFKLSYIRDISNVYKDKDIQINLFYKINILIILLLAVSLYWIIWYLMRSVRLLTKSTQTIAGGDYTQRVYGTSKDEIGVLAQNFNRMAEAVEDKVLELEVTAKQRQDFIDYLTHELKTPLTSMIGYADLLRTSKYNEEMFFKALDYIYSEGKRLESLSFRLMDLVLMGKEKPELKEAELVPLCLSIEAILQPQLEKSDMQLILSIEPCKLKIEKDLFKMLCTNLLDNAIKASKAGGRIWFRSYFAGQDSYAVEVEDEGMGIPEQERPNVLEPFYRVAKSRDKSHHSAGLGLAICSEIVKLHEGRLEISSRLNAGTKVKILLPKVYN